MASGRIKPESLCARIQESDRGSWAIVTSFNIHHPTVVGWSRNCRLGHEITKLTLTRNLLSHSLHNKTTLALVLLRPHVLQQSMKLPWAWAEPHPDPLRPQVFKFESAACLDQAVILIHTRSIVHKPFCISGPSEKKKKPPIQLAF